VREDIARAKYLENDKIDQVAAIKEVVDQQVKELHTAVTT
jgi:hypothetical protein